VNIQEEAAALRAAVSTEELAAVVAGFPVAEAITGRSNGDSIDPHFGERVPKDRRARVQY
jgi:hypothetical protein